MKFPSVEVRQQLSQYLLAAFLRIIFPSNRRLCNLQHKYASTDLIFLSNGSILLAQKSNKLDAALGFNFENFFLLFGIEWRRIFFFLARTQRESLKYKYWS